MADELQPQVRLSEREELDNVSRRSIRVETAFSIVEEAKRRIDAAASPTLELPEHNKIGVEEPPGEVTELEDADSRAEAARRVLREVHDSDAGQMREAA